MAAPHVKAVSTIEYLIFIFLCREAHSLWKNIDDVRPERVRILAYIL